MHEVSFLTLATAAVVLLGEHGSLAWHGGVFFYSDSNFSGDLYYYSIDSSQLCYSLARFDNKVSSVNWSGGLVQDGTLGDDGTGHAKIAFYTEDACQGDVRAWSTAPENFPSNFVLDGINDQVSSFMVWETSEAIEGIAVPQWLAPLPTLGDIDPNEN